MYATCLEFRKGMEEYLQISIVRVLTNKDQIFITPFQKASVKVR